MEGHVSYNATRIPENAYPVQEGNDIDDVN